MMPSSKPSRRSLLHIVAGAVVLSALVAARAGAQTSTAIAAGGGHTCALVQVGGINCWGSNAVGQLGNGTTDGAWQAIDVTGMTSGVQAVATGENFTCALLNGGGVRCWGANDRGQLGDGTTTNRVSPVAAPHLSLPPARALATGSMHACAMTSAGGVKCWGKNLYGQLGDGTRTDRLTSVGVSGLANIRSIVAGSDHTCVLTTADAVLCWGRNNYGQLGDGTKVDRTAPVAVTAMTSGVQAIAAGGAHTCALLRTGGVQCWGNNLSGQLGDGTRVGQLAPVQVVRLKSGVQSIVAGFGHTCALTTAGGVQCWGDNASLQLGVGSCQSTTCPFPVDAAGISAGAVAIAAGMRHTCALMSTRVVNCWGANFSGQLGSMGPTTTPSSIQVLGPMLGVKAISVGGHAGNVSRSHACLLTATGGAKCWGPNSSGQLGDGTTTDNYIPVKVVGLDRDVKAVTSASDYSCALKTSGAVVCWGWNGVGQLGDGTKTSRLTPVPVSGLGAGVQAIVAGFAHACALTGGGAVQCWGNNEHGALGDGTTTDRWSPVAVVGLPGAVQAISAGYSQTCALLTVGGVMCWGQNYSGELGNGKTGSSEQKLNPVGVSGLSSGVKAIATGASVYPAGGSTHTCALTTTGAVRCWGRNDAGQLGDAQASGKCVTGLPYFCSALPVAVSLPGTIQTIAAGGQSMCAVTSNGDATCWGSGKMTPTLERAGDVQSVAAGEGQVCTLSRSGVVACRMGGINGDVTDVMQRFESAVAPDGSGTMAVMPDTVASGSTGKTLTFVYTAAAGGTTSGMILLDIPSEWSPPSTTPTDAGFVEAHPGIATIDNSTAFGSTVAVSGLTLAPGQTVTLSYGSKSAGGPGATAPVKPAGAQQNWAVAQRSSPFGLKKSLGAAPSVVFRDDGAGAAVATADDTLPPAPATPPVRGRRRLPPSRENSEAVGTVESGRFRITTASGVITGGQVSFCSFETDPPTFAVLFAEGLIGGIHGKVRTRGPGVYRFNGEDNEGITFGLIKADMTGGFNPHAGTFTITSWTRESLSANFRFTTEPDSEDKTETVSGSFTATAVALCSQ